MRSGERPKTSRYYGALHAKVTVREIPRAVERNKRCVALVELANVSDSVWLSEPSPLGGFVTVGCKLLHPDGRLVDDTLERSLLPHDVEPGQQVRVRLPIGIPEHIHPGSQVLRVDAVNELMVWFSDLPGNEPHEFAVTIR